MPTALAMSCDTYFYQLGKRFYSCRATAATRCRRWAHRFGFGEKTGIDIGPEAAGSCRRPSGAASTYGGRPVRRQIDRIWKPGYSIQMAIGQGDLDVTPLQMARLYAMIANGGKLVTPHIAEDVEQPRRRRRAPQVLRRFGAQPPQPSGVDPAALAVVQHGPLRGDALVVRHLVRRLRQFPVDDRGQDGDAPRRSCTCPGYPYPLEPDAVVVVRLRARTTRPTIVVCALIENGGHGGTAAAPAALKVFEQYFHKHGRHDHDQRSPTDGDRSRRHAAPAACAPRRAPRRSALGGVAAPARLGAARRALAATGRLRAVGDRRDHAPRRRAARAIDAAGALRRRRRRRSSSSRCSIDPDVYRRCSEPIYFGTLALMVFVLVAGAATRGSRRWIDLGFFRFQPSEFGKVLFVLFLAGLPRRPRAAASTGARDARRDRSARARADRARLRAAGHRHRARLHRRARAVLFVAGVRWLHLGGARRRVALIAALACSGCCRPPGSNVLKPYQATRLTGFTHPDNDPRGATYNLHQSITAVGAGGLRGRGVAGATQTRAQLPARARDRLRLRLARGAARLLRRVDPAAALPARRLARR